MEKQLKLFSEKEIFIQNCPNFCTEVQKEELIEKWSNIANDLGYTDYYYDDEEDKIKLEKIFYPLFQKINFIEYYLEDFLDKPENPEDDEFRSDCDLEEYENWEEFIKDIEYDIRSKIKENVKIWEEINL